MCEQLYLKFSYFISFVLKNCHFTLENHTLENKSRLERFMELAVAAQLVNDINDIHLSL